MKFLKKRLRLGLRAFPRSVLGLGRGDTPLHEAARCGKAEVVELLVAANAPLDVQNEKGRGLSSDTTRSGPFGAWLSVWR